MDENFRRILRLVKKTGDKVVFFDSQEPENSFVALSLDCYEREVEKGEISHQTPVQALGLTDDDLADKINRDLENWRSQEESRYLAEEMSIGSQYFVNNPPKAAEKTKNWQIPGTVKEAAEEVIE